MECKIRKWKIDDAAELAATLNNKNIQDNLRDGLPYPYTEDDAKYYINEMLKADKSLRALKMSFLAARRSARELYPSTQRLSDWTNTGRPMWMNRLRIFRRIHSPVTSPYPLSLVLGRFPSSGSPFGFALSTLNTMMKSCLFINLSHFLPDRIIILYKI